MQTHNTNSLAGDTVSPQASIDWADVKSIVRYAYQALKSSPNFKNRVQQRELIGFAVNTLADGQIGIAEAPTGTGKTISYLISGIAASIAKKKRLVISTATVALQDQMLKKDLPAVINLFDKMGMKVNSTVLKGRERYLCPVKLDMFGDDMFVPETVMQLHNEFYGHTWNGEIENAPVEVKPIEWKQINNDRHTCTGKKCPKYGECPYYIKMIRAETSNVVIVNHDLLMNAIVHASKSVLSDFENNIYVFDEGHHLPDKAIAVFSSVVNSDLDWLPSRIKETWQHAKKSKIATDNAALNATIAQERIKSAGRAMAKLSFGKSLVRFPFGLVPEEVSEYLTDARTIVESIVDNDLAEIGKLIKSMNNQIHVQLFTELSGQLETLKDALVDFSNQSEEGSYPMAKWAELYAGNWNFKASPFEAGGLLNTRLWGKLAEAKSSALITSATLAALGKFDSFLRDMGLSHDNVSLLKLDTPYLEAYKKAKLIVPKMKASPERTKEHTDEVTANVIKAFKETDGGILVLFASAKQMREVAVRMPEHIKEAMQVQGETQFNLIIANHKHRIEQKLPSLIFGLATFAEGVDLPGLYLTRVIVAKIPFPSPDEPLIAASCEWMQQHSKAHPFSTILLPKAGIRFKQSVGRLLRDEDDWGEIVVLDNRLTDKTYGKQLMSGLPIKISRH